MSGPWTMTIIIFFSLFSSSCGSITLDTDTLTVNQWIRDDRHNKTIVSPGGGFELGFFSTGSPRHRYIGIWYKNISLGTVVWVANRDKPLSNRAGPGMLTFNSSGFIVLQNSTGFVVWSSDPPPASSSSSSNPSIAQLLDTGNLVVTDTVTHDYLWQSFDHPGNTFLPGMKYGANFSSGLNRYLTAWKSDDDPSSGNYTNRLDISGFPQMFLRSGSEIRFRSGPWNGLRFSGMPNLNINSIYAYIFVFNTEECYYEYQLVNSSVVTRMVLSPIGTLQRFVWISMKQGWELYLTAQMDNCDRFALCGPYGICDIDASPPCGCLPGFRPKSETAWDRADWSEGCVRKTELQENYFGFLRYPDVKLPDTRESWFDETMNMDQCHDICLNNSSCTAYANTDVRDGGRGCLLWFQVLIDLRQYQQGKGQDIFLKLANSDLGSSELVNQQGRRHNNKSGEKKKTIVALVLIPLSAAIVIIVCVYLFWLLIWRKRRPGGNGVEAHNRLVREASTSTSVPSQREETFQLPQFEFPDLVVATDNFSPSNKLGEGGFGPVYKGLMPDNLEIAVKRLSKKSRQGLDEFKNELLCIAKLQHRNLVKLLGCCIHGEERLLVYEYLPNNSLDYFIFDKRKSGTLDWPKRYNIINGISKGLLYLHEDSRLRVIHRDLKASNTLLDKDMNPKISDFGMARIFYDNETVINTTRVVGTYGYMAPEYAVHGIVSLKSDVYSLGVLMLETIMGVKNRGFTHPDHNLNLLEHVWKLFNEGKGLELIEPVLAETIKPTEVLRCLHIGLLCVQQSPDDRPSMSTVVLMLGSDMPLAQPKDPGFVPERAFAIGECLPSNGYGVRATNHFTITLVHPR